MKWRIPATRPRWNALGASTLALLTAVLGVLNVAFDPKPLTLIVSLASLMALVAFGLLVHNLSVVMRERAGEQQAAVMRLRARPDLVESIDVTMLGAAVAHQPRLSSRYLPRTVDAELDSALGQSFRSRDRWLLTLNGSSRVGKTRTLYEALARYSRHHDPITIVAPRNASSLMSLLDPSRPSPKISGSAVLWLDAIEPFIDGQVVLEDLQQWVAIAPRRRAVAATMGGRTAANLQELQRLSSVMQTVRLEPTTADELQPLKKQLNGHEFAAATAHGLAAHLTAAPLFIEKLRARTHPGDAQPCDEGGAVIQAVMDWMRCGRGDAIERDVLRLLWAYYLPQRTAPTDECFEAGLEWALRPVIGTASLLRVVSDTHYEIQQDVCSLALSGHDAELPPPREAAWIAALDALPDTERISVANAAMGYENWDTAGRAIEGAVEPADMVAKVWLTLGQRRLNDGQPEQARIAFQQALAAAAHETHQSMQRIAAAAAFGRATSLLVTGSEHVGEATRDLQQVYDAYHGSDDPFTKTAGLTALLLQAQTISGLGANHIAAPTRPLVPINPSPREESSAAQAVDLLTKLLAELRTTSRSPALQRRVHATALWYRAILAQVVKAPLIGRPALRSAAPVADLRRIIDAFSSDSDPAIRTLVLETTMWLGRLYSTEDVYAVCVGDDKDAQAAARAVQLAALREVDRRLLLPSTMSEYQFAQTLMTKTRLLGSLGTNKEILDTEISRITRDFGDSENVLVQNAVAVCRLLGAAAARKAGFANDAIKQYRSIARAYGGSSDDGLRSKVCTAEAAISELVASSDHPTCPQP